MSTHRITCERFQVLDHIPIGVFIINKDYSVVFWNACMEEWTGIPKSEISNADFRDFFPCFKELRYQGRIANVLEGVAPTILSPLLHRDALKSCLPSGEQRIQQIMILPVRPSDGSGVCALFVVEDVTELTNRIVALKNVRNELRKANDEMETRVEMRTADLAATNHRLELEIIDRMQIEKALEKERDIARQYLDVAGVMILIIGRDRKLRLINKKGCEILACSEQDALGKDWCDTFVPEDIRQTMQSIFSDLLSGSMEQFEYYENPVLTGNGGQRVIAWHNTLLRDENGEIDAILSSGEDITERKQAESTAKIAYMELETKNHELKQMQSQIVQNEKLASIGQLAAGVAHEMNTPVGFVASNFQTLESYVEKIQKLLEMYGELTEEIKATEKNNLLEKAGAIEDRRKEMKIDFILGDIEGLFDDSREGLERVANIVQNLRDFSRIDKPGSTDEYDFNRGIQATLVVARNEIKYDSDVDVEFCEVPTTRCHAGQINQVLLNILLNAAQAIKSQERQNRGTITIRTYATDTEVVCEISDDGPGIPAEVLPRIFEPFFTTKPAGKGTGLGLSVSYDIIVHKNDGKLLVDSTVGKGTKFTIRLPIRNEEISGEIEVESNGQENSVVCG